MAFAAAAGSLCLIGGLAVAPAALAPLSYGVGAATLDLAFTLILFLPLAMLALGAAWLTRDLIRAGTTPARAASVGAAIGGGGLVAAALLAVAIGGGRMMPALAGPALAIGMVAVLVQAGCEELFLRGWLQPRLARWWGNWPAVLAAAALFAALHAIAGAQAPLSFLNLLLGGILFGLLAVRGRGITGAVAAHFAWNAAEMLGLGLMPNPGVGSFGSLVDLDLTGPTLWGGSTEGLNASLAMMLVLIGLLLPLAIGSRRTG